MDMDKLTKQQIMLLTLLVSFVTSIATGIVTVSLLDQAPAGITQTINRVVEKTIETVVPQPALVIKKDPPIVIKQEDLVIVAVEKSEPILAGIFALGIDGVKGDFLGNGIVLTADGYVAAVSPIVHSGGRYAVELPHAMFAADPVLIGNSNVSILKIKVDEKKPLVPASLSSAEVKLGQTVLGIARSNTSKVHIGIISSTVRAEPPHGNESGTSTANTITPIEYFLTDLADTEALAGHPLVSLGGEVIGIYAPLEGNVKKRYIPVRILLEQLSVARHDSSIPSSLQ